MGGAGKVHKKIFAQGKIKWKKKLCTPINPKKYSCYGLKNNPLDRKNITAVQKFPLPLIIFLMVRPFNRSLQLGVLRDVTWYALVIFNYMPVCSSYDHCRIGSSRKYNSFLLVKNYANLSVINSNHITKYIKKHIFNYTLYILSNLQLNFPVKFQLITPDTWL